MMILSKEGSERRKPDDLWPEIPDDLWSEILSRLPVKSLVRFRCISKSWLSMINHPGFSRLHLENFKDNRNETHLLVVQDETRSCIVRCSDTFKTKTGVLDKLVGRWQVQCSIDGLVLLKSWTREVSGFHKLRLWNPSIRKFHDIPSLPGIEIEASANSSFTDHEIGLGYDPLAKDYKYVKLIFVNTNIIHSVAVYTLGARSWKIVPFQGKGKGCSNWRRMVIIHTTSVYLRGSLYFTARAFDDGTGRDVVALVSIDLSTELFSCTNLPSDGPYRRAVLTLVDDRCKLALFDIEQGALWVLDRSSTESEAAYWIRRYSFSLNQISKFLYLKKKGGDVFMWTAATGSIKYIGAPTVFEDVGVVSSYNLETRNSKVLRFQVVRSTDAESDEVWGYAQSLNLLV